ncbi:MAG TPA: response regulator [Balneolaceae bacterium]|nr:response regulator [Balneola sp.]HBQ60456.1 response regulator [Balneolaceae bacterium]|tara:strand:+ start:223009 stop:223410 length:402 start_codon:yes stop_codon:yes gene_type:complete
MLNQPKVMIVEDDPLLSIVEEKLVRSLGYEVAGKATSGEDAINSILDINPSILLMDIQLAGSLNGIETMKKLRNLNIEIPVIFLSGDNSDVVISEANAVNYTDFLLKPVSKAALSESLEKAELSLSSESQFAA